MSRTHYDVEVEHLLLKLLDDETSDFAFAARELEMDRGRLAADLSSALDGFKTGNGRTPMLSATLVNWIQSAWVIGSIEHDAAEIRTSHLLLALITEPSLSARMRQVTATFADMSGAQLSGRISGAASQSEEAQGAPGLPVPAARTPEAGESSRRPSLEHARRDVFLSYAHEDNAVAASVASALEASGIDVWYDVRIPAGETFASVIDQALDGCRCIVVLWSDASVSSNWVLEEAAEGLDRNILVPVRVADVPLPRGFKRIQTIDLVGWAGGREAGPFKDLLHDVGRILGRT